MNEIKFRGKIKNSDEWAFGFPYSEKGKAFIMEGNILDFCYQVEDDSELIVEHNFYVIAHEVDPETVGQYIGLKDKNGKEIYKDDVVEFMYKDPNNMENSKEVRCQIVFHEGMFCLKWKDGYINKAPLNPEKYTVVGKIHENPDLLK